MWFWNWFWGSNSKPGTEGSGGGEGGEEDKKTKKKVVVIGGGIGGACVAYQVQSYAQVTLIDAKEYLEIPWARVRASVDPSFAKIALIDYSEFLPKVQIITSTATNVTESEVMTVDSEPIEYDYLVVATGHVGYVARTRAEKLSYYQAEYEKIVSSSSILIIGGGLTGVELAGEIAVEFPEKKLTLVHRGSRLLEFIGSRASQKTFDWLTSKKVEVIVNQSIDLSNASDGVYQTSQGETVKADCHFVCTGLPMGSSWLWDTVLKDSLDVRGRLMVDDKFRVRGYKNVFAVGDVTDISEIRLGKLAQKHANVAAKNIKVLLMNGKENRMAIYKPGSLIAIVSLGKKDAVAQFPLLTIAGRFPGMMKSEDLDVGKTRKLLGLNPQLESDTKQKEQGEKKPTTSGEKDK